MTRLFPWAMTALSLIGVIANIKRRRSCFIIWIFSNCGWCIIDWKAGLHAQAALFFVYFVLAVWGLIEWRKGR